MTRVGSERASSYGALRMWPTTHRGGRSYAPAHPTARQPLVHRRSRRQARARPHDSDAGVEKGRRRCLDFGCRFLSRPGAASGEPGRSGPGRGSEREGRLAATPAELPLAFRASLPMTCVVRARSCAERLAVNWSRSSCCWATPQFRLQSDTLVRNRISCTHRTMGSS